MPLQALLRRVLPALMSLLLSVQAHAQTQAEPAGGLTRRGRLGLVLSGGGARGLAHIGVLRALERLRVPVDLIVGTSMGAVVGGAYAAGRSVAELEAFVHSADWDAILADRPQRRSLSFSRREEDLALPSRIELKLSSRGLSLPPAAAGNRALEHALEQLVTGARAELPANRLPLPFRALATDLLSGELQQMRETPLFLALRASMAVPGVFAPVRIEGRPLVDGGLVRNLGVDIARDMGADIIIAVNVGSPLLEERELSSAVGVANQMIQILTEQNVSRSLKELRPSDVLIDPQLDELGFMDFSRREQALEAGERSALATQERLAALALGEADYADHQRRRLQWGAPVEAAAERALPLGELRIEGARRSQAPALQGQLAHQLGLVPGAPVTQAKAEQAAALLMGSGEYERVDAQSVEREGQRDITLQLSEADWAFSRLRLGLELYSNFDDTHRFSVAAMHSVGWLNRWGAELRSTMRLGASRELSVELLQPLGAGSPWFVAPSTHAKSSDADLFSEGRRVGRYAYSARRTEVALGRRLGDWGDVRLGLGGLSNRARLLVPEQQEGSLLRQRFDTVYGQLRIDSLDSVAFPSRGQLLDLRLDVLHSSEEGGSLQLSLAGMSAFQWRAWAGHVYAELAHGSYGSERSLGGFLRLSGSRDESLQGQNIALVRLVMAKRIGQMPLGLGRAVRAGFSLEAGGGVRRGGIVGADDLKLAGSGFLAVDTRFGPFYLALGHTRGGGSAVYLFLGPVYR
jgi:NTE family protein